MLSTPIAPCAALGVGIDPLAGKNHTLYFDPFVSEYVEDMYVSRHGKLVILSDCSSVKHYP
jgi:hypothetical protein